jgi:hypothetical protein
MNRKNEITKALLGGKTDYNQWFWNWFWEEGYLNTPPSIFLVTIVFERIQSEGQTPKYYKWLLPLAFRLFKVLKYDEIQISETKENETFVSEFEEPENCFHGLLVSAEYCAELGKKLISVYRKVGSIFSLEIKPVPWNTPKEKTLAMLKNVNTKLGLYLIH